MTSTGEAADCNQLNLSIDVRRLMVDMTKKQAQNVPFQVQSLVCPLWATVETLQSHTANPKEKKPLPL